MNSKLKQWGATLVLLGIGSFILPLIGMQFRIFSLFGAAQPIIAIGAIVVGGILLLVGYGGSASAAKPASAASSSPKPAANTPASAPPPPRPNPVSASAAGASAAVFCGSCGQRLTSADMFCGNCGAAAPTSTVDPSAAYSQGPAVCPVCGMPECVGKEFCGNTGQRLTPPTVAPPVATPPPLAKARGSWGFGKVALVLLGILVLAGVGYFVVSSGLLRTAAQKLPAAMPKPMAGILTEFPVDTASANPVKPSNVSVQALGPGSPAPKFPQNSLPPGITPNMLPGMGTSIASAQFKPAPQDPPVNVHVVDVNGDPAQTTQSMAGAIASSTPGCVTTGVRVRSPGGGEYSGVRVRGPQIEVYVLGKSAGNVVIVIYAPEPAVMPTAERLAANVGNAGGLNDYPGITDQVNTLPAALPAGLQLVELQTYSPSELGLSAQQIGQTLGGQLGNSSDLAAQAQRFLPEQIMMARYRDPGRKEFNVLVGQYGNTFTAWRIWSLLRVTVGLASMDSIPVRDTTGLSTVQSGQQFIVFQTGSRLVVLAGPSSASSSVVQLAQGLQF